MIASMSMSRMCLLALCGLTLVAGALALRMPRRPLTSRAADRFTTARNDVVPPYKTFYFPQLVDHFNYDIATQGVTYQERYLYSDYYYDHKPTSPILVYVGNEGSIDVFYQNSGEMFYFAQQLNALLIFAEHRYYGESMPFGSASFDLPNLTYFSADQALADYAVLITSIKEQMNISDAPVIAMGGSYGGMLAAWARLKYPHVFVGAIAASGPVAQFPGVTDSEEFNVRVTNDYAQADPQCSKTIRRAMAVIEENFATGTPAAFGYLQKAMGLCSAPQKSDFSNLVGFFENILTDIAMCDYPYATNFLAPLPANPVNATCVVIANAVKQGVTDDSALDALAASVRFFFGYPETQCLNVSQPDTPDLGDLAWTYQTCTEMPMPIGSDGVHDMFVSLPWSDEQWSDYCAATFKRRPLQKWAVQNYGGRALRTATNIFFSQGSRDPWAGGGVLEQLSPNLPFCLIEGGAHHLDLRFPNPADPASAVDCRARQLQSIQQWMKM